LTIHPSALQLRDCSDVKFNLLNFYCKILTRGFIGKPLRQLSVDNNKAITTDILSISSYYWFCQATRNGQLKSRAVLLLILIKYVLEAENSD